MMVRGWKKLVLNFITGHYRKLRGTIHIQCILNPRPAALFMRKPYN